MKNFLTLIALLFISKSFANTDISCSAARLSQIIKISKNHIVFNENDVVQGRALASSTFLSGVKIQARTRFRGKSMEKTMYINGDKYLLHIQNINSYNSNNDYLIIKNNENHEIMYSIDCK